MIQILLSAGFLMIISYAIAQRRKSLMISMAIAGISATGILLVLFPNITSRAAHLLGVGRGADLILYCFVLITLVAIFNIHLRLRSSLEMTTALARALAIATAQPPQPRRSDDGSTSS